MTKKDALNTAIACLTENEGSAEVIGVLTKMVAQLDKPRTPLSDEAKEKANAKRKEATAEARKKLADAVIPVLKKYLGTPKTAKELYEASAAELPADFSAAKVQTYLLREMAPLLDKHEAKGEANTYVLIDR